MSDSAIAAPAAGERPLRVLLVEDSKHDEVAFRRALAKCETPCEITHVTRAEEALERLHRDAGAFDVLVTDHGLPGMHGLDLCLRLLEEGSPCALILLTGSGTEETAVRALKAGVHDYIVKDLEHGYMDLLPAVIPEVHRRYQDRVARRKAEETLRESEERFRNLVEGSVQGIYIHRYWKPLFVNRAFVELLGYDSVDEILALETLESLIAPIDRERLRGYLRARLDGRTAPEHYEYEALRKDGTTIVLDKVVRAVTWEGEPAFQHTVVDVTHRRMAELRARQHEAEIAQMGRLSTLGEMATTLAHQLNQPLTAIVSYTAGGLRRLRAESSPSPTMLEVLEQIELLAKRAAEVVRGIRRFVRQPALEWEPVDVNEVIAEALRLIAPEAEARGIAIRTELDPAAPIVHGDFVQIEQVVLNLIRNGLEAMDGVPANSVPLRVRSSARENPRALRVSICDGGTGLTPSVMDRMFDAFFSTKPHGLGVGLSINRTIVDNHGGQLWAEPNPEGGTSFHFVLPAESDNHGNST